jgi:hypothetical protein
LLGELLDLRRDNTNVEEEHERAISQLSQILKDDDEELSD